MLQRTLIAEYQNGNCSVRLYSDGTKEREFEGIPAPVHPESLDVKITNWCDAGCSYCHESSTTKGLHGDLGKLYEVLSVLPAGVEIACLSGDTVVFGQEGAIEIKDLKIGDEIFDSNHNLVAVTNIVKSNKNPVVLNCSKTLKVICSEDHPMMIDNEKVEAKNTLNKNLDLLSKKQINCLDVIQVDLSNFVTSPSPSGRGGAKGGKTLLDTFRLNHVSGWSNRFINLDADLMWFYGIVVAEGSRKGISLNANENDIADRAISLYKKFFNRDSAKYVRNNSMSVEFKTATLYRSLFFEEMKIGRGARNKSIGFLFTLDDINLIRAALFGMFQGDGAFRKRKEIKRASFGLTYKTTSKKLAYEIVYLLRKYFGICASLYYGVSPDRNIEGRLLKSSDYYKIDIYNKEDIQSLFPDLFNNDPDFIAIGTKKYSNTNPIRSVTVNSINKLKTQEVLYDITLEDSSSHVFPINGYILTHNCGGGDPLSHPDLIPFLQKLKAKGIVSNITINQKHLKPRFDLIQKLVTEDLVKGVGISYSSSGYLKDIQPILNLSHNVVFHVIMGVNSVDDIEELRLFCEKNKREAKILVLGYKNYGFGIDYYLKNKKIEDNKYRWYSELAGYFKKKNLVLSFDNLAISQMNLKRFFTQDGWDKFFMGADFTYTMYVDGVDQNYAPSSTSKDRISFSEMNLLKYFQTYKKSAKV